MDKTRQEKIDYKIAEVKKELDKLLNYLLQVSKERICTNPEESPDICNLLDAMVKQMQVEYKQLKILIEVSKVLEAHSDNNNIH